MLLRIAIVILLFLPLSVQAKGNVIEEHAYECVAYYFVNVEVNKGIYDLAKKKHLSAFFIKKSWLNMRLSQQRLALEKDWVEHKLNMNLHTAWPKLIPYADKAAKQLKTFTDPRELLRYEKVMNAVCQSKSS